MSTPPDDAVARVHHQEWARVVAGLARRFGDLDIAEEATSEAFLAALERWPRDGIPPNPGGWITTTAICCHPALSMETRIALTLRLVGGLTVGPSSSPPTPPCAPTSPVGATRAPGRRLTSGSWHR